jgi:nicotinate-nucleotide pyrophosphorylase (carboxylating)
MNILADVVRALEEDIGSGDVTAALLPEDLNIRAEIISREPMLVCGLPWVDLVFSEVDSKIDLNWCVGEGSWQALPTKLCEITGPVRTILTAERTALNFLQTLSGTATETYLFLDKLKGSRTRLLDTRKTIPGLRTAQKYAIACAGGVNHRMGLYDAFLIKENHIKACGSISAAIRLARKSKPNLFIEVEVESLDELKEAISLKPDRVMLDNFDASMIDEAILINESSGCELEVSGNVDLTTIAAIGKTNVDFVSVGKLTKSVRAIDLSLLIVD